MSTVTIEHATTREQKELELSYVDRKQRRVFVLWPMAGTLEFDGDGRGRGAASDWRVLGSELTRLGLAPRVDPMIGASK